VSGEMSVYKIALTMHECDQLVSIGNDGLVSAGGLLSHEIGKSLFNKGLVSRLDGYYVLTRSGQRMYEFYTGKQIEDTTK